MFLAPNNLFAKTIVYYGINIYDTRDEFKRSSLDRRIFDSLQRKGPQWNLCPHNENPILERNFFIFFEGSHLDKNIFGRARSVSPEIAKISVKVALKITLISLLILGTYRPLAPVALSYKLELFLKVSLLSALITLNKRYLYRSLKETGLLGDLFLYLCSPEKGGYEMEKKRFELVCLDLLGIPKEKRQKVFQERFKQAVLEHGEEWAKLNANWSNFRNYIYPTFWVYLTEAMEDAGLSEQEITSLRGALSTKEIWSSLERDNRIDTAFIDNYQLLIGYVFFLGGLKGGDTSKLEQIFNRPKPFYLYKKGAQIRNLQCFCSEDDIEDFIQTRIKNYNEKADVPFAVWFFQTFSFQMESEALTNVLQGDQLRESLEQEEVLLQVLNILHERKIQQFTWSEDTHLLTSLFDLLKKLQVPMIETKADEPTPDLCLNWSKFIPEITTINTRLPDLLPLFEGSEGAARARYLGKKPNNPIILLRMIAYIYYNQTYLNKYKDFKPFFQALADHIPLIDQKIVIIYVNYWITYPSNGTNTHLFSSLSPSLQKALFRILPKDQETFRTTCENIRKIDLGNHNQLLFNYFDTIPIKILHGFDWRIVHPNTKILLEVTYPRQQTPPKNIEALDLATPYKV